VSQYITKGKQVYVEGRLQTRSWDDDQGQKHYRTEVIANTIQLLGSRSDGDGGGGGGGGWGDGERSFSGGNRGGSRGGYQGRGGGYAGGGGNYPSDPDDLPFE
jgi:single-strand DNA-binding protein